MRYFRCSAGNAASSSRRASSFRLTARRPLPIRAWPVVSQSHAIACRSASSSAAAAAVVQGAVVQHLAEGEGPQGLVLDGRRSASSSGWSHMFCTISTGLFTPLRCRTYSSQ